MEFRFVCLVVLIRWGWLLIKNTGFKIEIEIVDFLFRLTFPREGRTLLLVVRAGMAVYYSRKTRGGGRENSFCFFNLWLLLEDPGPGPGCCG